MKNFVERHKSKIKGVISCFDRIVLTGTIPGICYAQGMSSFLTAKGIRIFDFTQWADPLRQEIRTNAEKVAIDNDLEIEFIRKKNFRKEDRINDIIKQRGTHPGLVHIYSAMEVCTAYKPWHNKKTHNTYLKTVSGKCLHYYFYFINAELGLCYLRVPTWAPFRLQFYCNGHNLLASRLNSKKIDFQMLDNVFVQIGDFDKAQKLADDINVKSIHRQLNKIVRQYCPIVRHFANNYHWSFMQVEYATDIIFRKKYDLKLIYDEIVRTAIHSVKPEHIATFLGRKLHGGYQDEMGNNFNTRIEGTCIKHRMGKVAVKMYDKFGIVLRVETVANDVSFFKHHRRVEHRDGTWEMKNAPLKKSIYSMPMLVELMKASNRRYIEFIAAIDDPSGGIKDMNKISRSVKENDRSYRGFNLFDGDDLELFSAIIRGEFNISGFSNRCLRKVIKGKKGHQISRLLKRMRKHGLIKKIANTYKYYLTALGRRVTATALKLREMYIIPSLRGLIVR
ncbi:MAG: MarR family transcriptional regulator [Planctomycetes bacterium]|nr:MarR family transcriptional regulator [Planctomycetota bacterium]